MPRPKLDPFLTGTALKVLRQTHGVLSDLSQDDAALIIGFLCAEVAAGTVADMKNFLAPYVAARTRTKATPLRPVVFTGSITPGRN